MLCENLLMLMLIANVSESCKDKALPVHFKMVPNCSSPKIGTTNLYKALIPSETNNLI